MFSRRVQKIDETILFSIQRMRIPPLTWIMIFFTWTGMGQFWWVVALSVNLINRFRLSFPPDFLNAFYAPLLVWGINYVLKRVFKRNRPAIANNEIIPMVKTPPCFSFPSSHAGSTFAFFFILFWWDFPKAMPFGIWALIVSFSRMYLGVHYLTDILGGILVGLIASGIIYLIF